ncbi:hypothetical protein [Corynebacterium resistens]|uniref:hypothetical protein n=1 Tax=Corynebacterium resistens TaxID=258224 RepID=UPI002355EA33|nr:hypothetical protein [Corynebacterium resistens]
MKFHTVAVIMRYVAFLILLALLLQLNASGIVIAVAVVFIAATAVVDVLNHRMDNGR